MEALKDLEVVWDSKLRLWNCLNEYAKENGWTYDKGEKAYIKSKADKTEAEEQTPVTEFGEEEIV